MTNREKAENKILENITKIKSIRRLGEDCNENATIQDLIRAIDFASEKELEKFLTTNTINEDYDYILKVTFKR